MRKSLSSWQLKPVAHSSNIARVQRAKIPRENERIISRLTKVPPGVQSVESMRKEYDVYKQRVFIMQRFNQSGQRKPIYREPERRPKSPVAIVNSLRKTDQNFSPRYKLLQERLN